jgi:23S rRNA (cytosine1962-C5)-methyltransferase
MAPEIHLLNSPHWKDYDLLDSGDGLKLERFGSYTFIRPEVNALWKPSLSPATWDSAHAVFQPSGEESGGHWSFTKKVPDQWEMNYTLPINPISISSSVSETTRLLRFSVMTTPGRHLGVFPECASHWDWLSELIINRNHSPSSRGTNPNILNLFGYTGLATLTCAASSAKVTHVDASRKSVSWARANLELSGLADKPVRWVVDDALKYVEREARRGVKYDGILLDPPKFGRGPKGEVWEVYKSLPRLLQACRAVLNNQPLFVILTIYAVKLPAIHVYSILSEMMEGYGGDLECGELVTVEKNAGRLLSQAVYARWKS